MLDGSSCPPLASVEMVSELHHFTLSLLMRGWFVLVKSMFLTCKRWKKDHCVSQHTLRWSFGTGLH
jgi:hypothetical protein